MTPGDRAWDAACSLITARAPEERITWTLIALRGQLPPGHPVLGLLEEQRAVVRGERSALSDEELAPLYAWAGDILSR